MAVLGGEVCAIEDCEAFAALEAAQVIVDIIDQKTIISDPSLALKAKFQWNLKARSIFRDENVSISFSYCYFIFIDFIYVFVLETIVF